MRDPVVASSLVARPVEWLWRKHIPKGMICVVAGRPDQGKGLFAAHVAAEISRRGGNVLYSAAEDDPARMTRPRLEAAGADLDRILVWRFRLPQQQRELERKVIDNDIRLVVMDPMASHVGGGVSRHSDNIRRITDPMNELCEATGVTFLIIEHALKRIAASAEPISMIGGGGSGLPAAARAAFMFGKDPKDHDRRLLAPVKLNIAEWPKTLVFEVDVEETDTVENVPMLLFSEMTDEPAGILLEKTGKHSTPGRPPDKRAAAAEWLARYLYEAGKPVQAGEVVEDAKQRGLTTKTLRRAADDMGVVRNPPGGGRKCKWSLPPQVTKMIAAAEKEAKRGHEAAKKVKK